MTTQNLRAKIPGMVHDWYQAVLVLPFLIVLKISLSQTEIAQPPYTPVLDPAAGWAGFKAFVAKLSFDNYAFIVADRLYLSSYLKSLEVAAISTLSIAL